MLLSLEIGATGMLAQQTHVDVISNNIANMTTTGFKRQRPEFEDLLYQNKVRPGATSSSNGNIVPAGIQLGLGVKPASVYRINEQGPLSMTDNEYDMALMGRGWFQITMPNGETAYTRAGNFSINADGQIVTQDGYELSPAITIPANVTSTTISEDGVVTVKIDGQDTEQQVGQIELASFINDAGLEAVGNNLFKQTEASGAPTTGNAGDNGFARIRQGARESSNVNVVEEITQLITAQRAYEMNSKVIQTSDDMLNTLNQIR